MKITSFGILFACVILLGGCCGERSSDESWLPPPEKRPGTHFRMPVAVDTHPSKACARSVRERKAEYEPGLLEKAYIPGTIENRAFGKQLGAPWVPFDVQQLSTPKGVHD